MVVIIPARAYAKIILVEQSSTLADGAGVCGVGVTRSHFDALSDAPLHSCILRVDR